ncbi:MAG: hypothetical protein QNK16_10010 [Woeseiaceae bacterium]|nr:hypothetical protein [Woeseiaceae bacterium]MDX2608706.1 hypothetical protein [Woeseiaceae bacterium]
MKYITEISIWVTSIFSLSSKNYINLSTRFAAVSLTFILAACGSSGSSTSPVVVPPSSPAAAPLNVQVVSGDGNGSEIENTISWTLDSAATDYAVYWDNVPGVTASSSVVVPAAAGSRYVTHSGVDVLAGNSYYYRVQATSAGGASALSAEVTGTPQMSITSNALTDVAWNGIDTLVAVGDAGVILNSPNGLADAWVDASAANVPQALTGVTWEDVNSQFMIVGAGSTVLSGDGSNWNEEDLSTLPGAVNLEDVAWLGDKYIAVGKSGAIVTSNGDGSVWTLRDAGANVATISLNAVARNNDRIVVVGTNGAILNSVDGVTWELLPDFTNNNLNDISWDGSQFSVVGSNDTILTSADGITWTSHIPGTSDINFVAATQWDSGLPLNPVLGAVGSAGTFVVSPDSDPGVIIRTGTTEQLGGMTWVDDGLAPAYFVIVGNDGTVLTNQLQ